MRQFINIMESSEYPHVIETYDLLRVVAEIHHSPEDLEDGNLSQRLWKFHQYVLEEIPLSDLNPHEFAVDDRLAKDYFELYMRGEAAPPIVYDSVGHSIIDGTHRVRAAIDANLDTILGYVEKAEFLEPNYEEDDEEDVEEDDDEDDEFD